MTATDTFNLVGTTIAGKFRIERVLGEGGFGVVYAGTHVMLGERVAIKCLKPLGFTPEERERGAQSFLREGRILFGLGHPAIVRLYDVGVIEEGQIPYVVLELLAGKTLDAELRLRGEARRHFGREELVALFGPILEAVAFAHERGIVHRDLKPSNLMLVTEAGRMQPKVLDFGTARADAVGTGRAGAAPDVSMGKTGFTPLYAAPEQWDAVYGATGARTDVFALGLTIAEACLLTYPMEIATGNILSVFKASLDDSSRPVLAQKRPDLPPELEQVINRAMRARPEQRYADARELLNAFRSALKVAPATAPLAPSSPPVLAASHSPSQSPSYGPPQVPSNVPLQAPSYSAPYAPAYSAPPMMGASTTQPHALGMYGQTMSPQRARSSPLPWIIGIAGLVVAIVVVAIGVTLALVLPGRQEPVAVAPTAAPTSAPAAPPKAAAPGAPVTPQATAPAAPARPAVPVAAGPTPRIILSGAIGMAPFWTQADVMDVARQHQGDMVQCAREGNAAAPGLQGDVDVTVDPDKNGVVGSVQCSLRGTDHKGAGEAALCGCVSAAMGKWKYPPARAKLGLLDSGPFIYDFKLFPP
jgi:serine/threonine-protein kinase